MSLNILRDSCIKSWLYRERGNQAKLSSSCSSEVSQIIEAEVRMAVLTACSNVSLAFHNHLSPQIRKAFPDLNVAPHYHSASIIATCMLNLVIAPMLRKISLLV